MPNEHVKVWVQSNPHDPREYPGFEVVPMGPPRVLRHKESGNFLGRLPEMNLSGYGETVEEAQKKVEKWFRFMVRTHREVGGSTFLERWLAGQGVKWEWSNGPEDELVYQ